MSERAEKRESEKASRRESEQAREREGEAGAESVVAEMAPAYGGAALEVAAAKAPAEDIAELVDGLDPVDWVQVRLTAGLSPGQRIRSAMEARAFAVAGLKATFRRRFPELSEAELNLRVLAYLTPVRLPGEERP